MKCVSFSVLVQEPMTKDELKQVKSGIEIDPWPAVLRWVKRSKLNDSSKVLYVEQPAHGSHTAADISALAACIGNCQRKFQSKARKRK